MKTSLLRYLTLAVALACGALSPAAHAAPYTWQGPPNSWSTAPNWNPPNNGTVPGLPDDAIFPSGLGAANSQVLLTAPASFKSLTFNGNLTFNLGSQGLLTPALSMGALGLITNSTAAPTYIHPDLVGLPGAGSNLELWGTGAGKLLLAGNILGQPNLEVFGGNYAISPPGLSSLTLNALRVNSGGWLEIGVSNGVAVNSPVLIAAGGTLRLCDSASLGGVFTAPSFIVNGLLQVSGAVSSGNVNVAPGGTLSGGCSPGTFNLTGNLNLDPAATLVAELATPGTVGGGVNDLIIVNGNLTLAGTLNVTALPGFGPGVYRLFNYSGTLTDNGLNLVSAPPGFNYAISTATANQVNLIVSSSIFSAYYTKTILPGYNFIANQLDRGANTLAEVLPDVPPGSTLTKLDEATQTSHTHMFDEFDLAWIDLTSGGPSTATLAPGAAAFLFNPGEAYPLTFIGQPRVRSIRRELTPTLLYYLSRQTPGPGTWESIVGDTPVEGGMLVRWDAVGQAFRTNQFTSGHWQPSAPVAEIGEGVVLWLPPDTTPPVITTQPQDVTVMAGEDAVFSVAVSGAAPITKTLVYTDLPGFVGASSTNGTLVLRAVFPYYAGSYQVTASNAFGTATSQVVRLTVTARTNIFAWVDETGTLRVFGTAADEDIEVRLSERDTNLVEVVNARTHDTIYSSPVSDLAGIAFDPGEGNNRIVFNHDNGSLASVRDVVSVRTNTTAYSQNNGALALSSGTYWDMTCPGDMTLYCDGTEFVPGYKWVSDYPHPSATFHNWTGAHKANVICRPASGLYYPVGTTRVCCEAIWKGVFADEHKHTCCFNITIVGAGPCAVTPGPSFSANFNSGLSGITTYGAANVSAGPFLQLTPAAPNAQFGVAVVPPFNGATLIHAFRATFDLYIGDGTRADGFSFNLANDLPSSFGYATYEQGVGTGLTVEFDTFSNGAGDPPGIFLKSGGPNSPPINGTVMLLSPIPWPWSWPPSPWPKPGWTNVKIEMTSCGYVTVFYDGWLRAAGNVSYVPGPTAQFALAARTGYYTDNHLVDNLVITTESCTPDITVPAMPGQCGAFVNYPIPCFTSGCGIPNSAVVCTPPPGSYFPLGINRVCCKLGSQAECGFNVIVKDLTPPTCGAIPALASHPCAGLHPPMPNFVIYAQGTATDNCTAQSDLVITQNPPWGAPANPGVNTVTLTICDKAGNCATCTTTYSVVADTVPPIVTCGNIVAKFDYGCIGFVPNYLPAFQASDNCLFPLVLTQDPTPGSAVGPGVTTVTLKACDIWGNCASCTTTYTLIAPPQGCACAGVEPPSGLVLWLPFDEPNTSGVAHNIAGGNNGVYQGAPTVNNGGYVDRSLCFNGVNQYVPVPYYSAIDVTTGDFSIDAWVKLSPGGDTGLRAIVDHRASFLIFTGGGGTIGYGLYLNNGKLTFHMRDNNNGFVTAMGGTVPADNGWHFVAVTVKRNSTTGGTLYVDNGAGVLSATTFNPTPASGSLATGYGVNIGASDRAPFGATLEFFKGCIDEVEIFNRELGPDQVEEPGVTIPGEVTHLFRAGPKGKCKFSCSLSNVRFCSSDSFRTATATLCNNSASGVTFTYGLAGLSGCGTLWGGLNFGPPPAPVYVPAWSCKTVTFTVPRPSGMAWFKWGCLRLLAQINGGGTISCSSVVYGGFCWNPFGTGTVVLTGANATGRGHFSSGPIPLVNPFETNFVLNYRISVKDHDMHADKEVISLNGLPPGEFITSTVALAPGESTTIAFDGQFREDRPNQTFYVLVEGQNPESGEWAPLADIPVTGIFQSRLEMITQPVDGQSRSAVTWNSIGTLQSAPSLGGPWTDLPEAASPYIIPADGSPARFYRVKQ